LISASWSYDGQTWSVIGTDIVPMAATIYVGLAVTSHDAGSIATAAFDNVSVTADAADTWTSQDIGAVGAGGWVAASDDSFAVTASGSDIWGTEDAFRFTYRAVSGNFDVTARVASVEAVDQWTKAGVMIRASTDADSAHVSAFATPSTVKGLAFQRRPASGAPSVHSAGPALAPAVWIRLVRQGSVISAWSRVTTSDAWTAIGSDVVALPSTVLVGLGVTSHQYGELATAVFDNVSITSLP